ncbi:uncharacterized protein LOC123670423 [Melitaea cinxia]|uniref:uncharacterized protein LOC123670423 n=1 Tax=Melitaea cinxia TaxID=113334 RepID=UPI001E273DB4|nr:uncharacterized protein LOC123670423 [Melitaea cinxia]
MDETVIFPSPNWFQVSGLAVSKDGWLIYGGPTKNLCILKPLESSKDGIFEEKQAYHAYIINKAHKEKIVSVDISRDWPEKKLILTGGIEGTVKQWDIDQRDNLGKIKCTHNHTVHENQKEEVVAVEYSSEPYAITVGFFGNIVKWDLNANITKTYTYFLKNFKPTCMACSHHIPLHVAVGTKQGVVFVLDLKNQGKILYKIRGQDDEILNLSWCPQYEVTLRKSLINSVKKSKNSEKSGDDGKDEAAINLHRSAITKSLPEDSFCDVQEDDLFDMYKDHQDNEFGHKKFEPKDIVVKVKKEEQKGEYLEDCSKLKDKMNKNKKEFDTSMASLVDAFDKTSIQKINGDNQKVVKENTTTTATTTTAATTTTTTADGTILAPLSTPPSTPPTNTTPPKPATTTTTTITTITTEALDDEETKIIGDYILHTHRHLLASIGKYGAVRIWSKTGKLIASCTIPISNNKIVIKNKRGMQSCNSILWYKPEVLLMTDTSSQLLQSNPLEIDCKNNIEYNLVHNYHKRGLYGIYTNAPRVQSDGKSIAKSDKSTDQSDVSSNESSEMLQDVNLIAKSDDKSMDKSNDNVLDKSDWKIWTVAQDRNIICYSMEKKEKIAAYNTCGGFIYSMHLCPYDAKRLAISVGDGAIRVWDAQISDKDGSKYLIGSTMYFWQNVQGKVLTVAWHPTKENLLAFATAESRIGIIDASKTERAAKNLQLVLSGGIYAISWGEDFNLYAVAGGTMVMYNTTKPEGDPKPVIVEFENKQWELSAVTWYPAGLLCGSNNGAVAILNPETHELLSAIFVYNKMIHCMDWHPQHVTESNEESQYKNLIAVSSLDKQSVVTILEYTDKGDGLKLNLYKTLSGHAEPACQLAWNPHKEGILLTTSYDKTVRVWDVSEGQPIAIFDGHTLATFTACWSPYPNMPTTVMSGGADCCLRMWKYEKYPANVYLENHKNDAPAKKEKKKKEKKEKKIDEINTDGDTDTDGQVATNLDQNVKIKGPKKFLLPIVQNQISPCTIESVRIMAQKYLQPTNEKEVGKTGRDTDENMEVDSGAVDSAAVDSGAVDSGAIDSGAVDSAAVDSAAVDSGAVDSSAVDSSAVDSGPVVSGVVHFTKMFGTTNDLNELLDLELHAHLAHERLEPAALLGVLRGHVDAVVRRAAERDALCPFIVSLAPLHERLEPAALLGVLRGHVDACPSMHERLEPAALLGVLRGHVDACPSMHERLEPAALLGVLRGHVDACPSMHERLEPAALLGVLRGHVDAVVRRAAERDALCPFIVSLAPCVSFKYWKSVTQLYLAQIDRLVAKHQQNKLIENKQYGGHIYRKVAHQLSIHDVLGAVSTLTTAKHFKEAYVLAKARHMDSIAEDILSQWTADATLTGNLTLAAVCNLAMGDVYKASLILAKSKEQECLALAAELAKVAGQPTFAHHIEDKITKIETPQNETEDKITKIETPQNETEALQPLPSKAEVMLKEAETNGSGNNKE